MPPMVAAPDGRAHGPARRGGDEVIGETPAGEPPRGGAVGDDAEAEQPPRPSGQARQVLKAAAGEPEVLAREEGREQAGGWTGGCAHPVRRRGTHGRATAIAIRAKRNSSSSMTDRSRASRVQPARLSTEQEGVALSKACARKASRSRRMGP